MNWRRLVDRMPVNRVVGQGYSVCYEERLIPENFGYLRYSEGPRELTVFFGHFPVGEEPRRWFLSRRPWVAKIEIPSQLRWDSGEEISDDRRSLILDRISGVFRAEGSPTVVTASDTSYSSLDARHDEASDDMSAETWWRWFGNQGGKVVQRQGYRVETLLGGGVRYHSGTRHITLISQDVYDKAPGDKPQRYSRKSMRIWLPDKMVWDGGEPMSKRDQETVLKEIQHALPRGYFGCEMTAAGDKYRAWRSPSGDS